MLIKMSSGGVRSHHFGEAGPVFRARPVASLLKGSDAGRMLPATCPHRAPWGQRNYLAFPGTTTPVSPGMPEDQPWSRLNLGMFWEHLMGLDADAPSASIPWHRSHCTNLIMKKGKRKKTRKQGTSVLSILQQLATV